MIIIMMITGFLVRPVQCIRIVFLNLNHSDWGNSINIRDNVIIIQNNPVPPGGGTAGPSMMCKLACIAAAAQIVLAAAAICTGFCFLVSAVTVGATLVPCLTIMSVLCAGPIFAGGQAAYELCLTYWGV